MQGQSPKPAHTPTGAVFLSYASEDAAAAERIASALQEAGVEVWFDRSELRGGDAWDSQIRQRIHDCRLFIAIVSANTERRDEGYFRREWKLAVDRTHDMAEKRAFLVPVVIDETAERGALVPDKFRERQWTRLPAGETSPAFVERVRALLAPATERPHAGPPPVTQRTVGATQGQRAPGPRRATVWAFSAIGLVAVATYFGLRWSADRGHGEQRTQSLAAAGGEAIPEKSIAVLPFVDMSEEHDQGYFSDGLAEELLDLLSQVPDLRVPARTSSFYFKGRSVDIATIAQKLRVAHVLEGSVRHSGKRVRVTAELIRADNGYNVWSKTYDSVDKDIFELQDEIANAVVGALKAQLLPDQALASRHRTDNTEAYSEYLLGNELRERDTPDANRKALEAYQRAAVLDPGYAAAYAGISNAEWRNADMTTAEPAAYQRSLKAAERAIELAPNSADGYWARGGLRMTYYYDWSGAERDFKRALELDPNDVRVLRDYGALLATRTRTAEALAAMRKAVALDPLAAETYRQLAHLQLDIGQVTEAKHAAQYLEALRPEGYRYLSGAIALAEGRAQDALADYNDPDSGPWKLIGGAMAEHTLGHAVASQADLNEAIREYAKNLAYQIAEAYAWCGERDAAFAWLERAYRQHDGGMGYLSRDRFFTSLRDDPRYRALLKKLNLA